MRKRLFVLLLAALVLTGCGGKTAPFAAEDIDRLLEADAFPGSDMEVLESDVLVLLYGLDGASVTDCVGYLATNTSVSADEAAVFILTDDAAAAAAEEACRARIEAQIAMCRTYCPDAVPRLEDAFVARRGNTVLLAVGGGKIITSVLEK